MREYGGPFNDDDCPVTQEWLELVGAKVDGRRKRLTYIWETAKASVYVCVMCGHLCPILGLNGTMILRNPTRADVRRLLRAIGLSV